MYHPAYCVLRDCVLAGLALITENVESSLTPALRQNKYNYKNCVRKTPVFKTNWLVFVARLPLAVNKKKSKSTDKTTCKNLIPSAVAPYRISSVKWHTLAFDENGVASIIRSNRASSAFSNKTNNSVGEEQYSRIGELGSLEKEHEAPEGKVAESGRCDTNDRHTIST